MLRCSEWWVKEQARRRRIPYAWIGGSYLFTAEHIAEIVRRFEVRPTEAADQADPPLPPARRPVLADTDDQPIRLRARTPRWVRDAGASRSTAA
jgi:hypothetical protein